MHSGYYSARRTRARMLLAFAALCVLAIPGYTQRYPFHNLNVDEGLIQSQATCLAQDKTGNLWIGTLGGLTRYDGRNCTNYTVRNGLLNNTIWSVGIDSTGDVWVGSMAGISRFDGKKFTHYTVQPQPTTRGGNNAQQINNTQQIQVVRDTTWWRTGGEVYYVTQGKIKFFSIPGKQGYVSSILAENSGLWIAREDGIYHRQNNTWDSVKFAVEGEHNAPSVYRIFRDKDNVIWLATNMGLYRIVNGKPEIHTINETPLNFLPGITSITQDNSGVLWLGTNSGVVKVSANMLQYYNKKNGLSDNIFFDMLTDAEGSVWMASDGQGVYRFSGTQFTGIDESMGLPSAQVMAIGSNRRDSLFLGTYDAGLFVFKDGKVNPLAFPSDPVPSITSLCYTPGGKLWIGTRGRGLWSYDRNIFRQYEAPDRHFPSNFINALYSDPEQRLWIGFANGVVLYANDSFKAINTGKRGIFSFLYLGADSMLIATENDLLLYNNDSIVSFLTNTLADSAKVQCFIKQGKYLWLGTGDNGVIRYDMQAHKALVINKSQGMRSDFIYNIVADDDGNIWVGTGFGIHKISIDEQDHPRVTFYGKAQGITGMESNINSVLKMPDGSVWFGTTNGALHYQPRNSVVTSTPTSIVMQSVKLIGEANIDSSYYESADGWYGIPRNLRLPYKKNNISFTFQAITLSGAQQVLYRYHMDGLETPWSDWSANNSVAYSALPPGKYTFRVQCQGAEGMSSKELTYEFEIITPFQKTAWFRLSVLVACLLLGVFIQYLVNSRKQRRQRLLEKLRSEEQAKIRLRTAEDFHDEIGNKLTRINVLTNVLKSKIELTPEASRLLGQISDNTNQLYGGTRDILWSLKPANDNLYEILHRIRDFAGELLQDTEINFTFTGTDEKWRTHRLPMDMSRNLIMIFKEALNNALKYSHAHNISLDISLKNRTVLNMVLKDDGEGFDVQVVRKGNGLINMNTRAERLGGKLYIDSRKGKGTIISLTFKIPQNR